MEQFMINCIEILCDSDGLDNQALYKNLKKGKYLLNDYYSLDEHENLKKNNSFFDSTYFYGEGINVQAIVGKNGCGKSTLMDLLFAAANNYGYIIDRDGYGESKSNALYIADLYIRLYYTLSTNDYALTFKDDEIYKSDITGVAVIDEDVVYQKRLIDEEDEGQKRVVGESFCYNPNDARVLENTYKGGGLNDDDKKTALGKFFYTIVSNYSIHSFVDQNYNAAYYIPYKQGNTIEKEKDSKNKSWIRAIFHKNDGYFKPIVLNPFRKNGNINVNNEIELSKDRLASLLIFYSKRDADVLSPYILKKLNLNFCKEYDSYLKDPVFLKKLYQGYQNFKNEPDTADLVEYFMEKFAGEIVEKGARYFVSKDNPFLQMMLKKFELPYIEDNDVVNSAYTYLQLKMIKIISNYSSFEKYEKAVRYDFSSRRFVVETDQLEKFLDDVIKDNSHITRKIRRTVNFLALGNGDFKKAYDWNKKSFFARFSFATRSIFLRDRAEGYLNIDDINDCLPPPFFEYNLIMDKKGELGSIIEENVDYHGLSSGETQMLQTLSVHAYHISNLLSVPSDRIKYDNINLVFDEVEMCFHPEFQRQFVNRLVEMLKEKRSIEKKKVQEAKTEIVFLMC